MANKRNRRGEGKGIYVILLVLIAFVLVFAVGMMTKKSGNQTESKPDASNPTTAAEPLVTQSGTALTTSDIETEPATPTTEPTTSATEPTTSAVPLETLDTGSGTMMQTAERSHIYIRVNHEKTLTPPAGFGADTTYRISDDNVAYVEEGGRLIGLEKGSCTLIAEWNGQAKEIPVTVREMTVENGCTYVDDILVANKSYSLPREYNPGLLPVTEEAFAELSAAAKKEGLDIFKASDFRTYDFQEECYNSMVNGYSKEYADAYSARPGHSEHQTGYTIDCNSIDNTFADTAAGKWLAEHCWEYGFILRYPADKVDLTGYAYESWHIRYVGKEHAKAIWEQGICLEEYLDIDSKYAE